MCFLIGLYGLYEFQINLQILDEKVKSPEISRGKGVPEAMAKKSIPEWVSIWEFLLQIHLEREGVIARETSVTELFGIFPHAFFQTF